MRERRMLAAASGRARTGRPLLRAQQSQRSALVGRLRQPVTSRAQSSSSAGEGTGVCMAGGGADRCGAVRRAASRWGGVYELNQAPYHTSTIPHMAGYQLPPAAARTVIPRVGIRAQPAVRRDQHQSHDSAVHAQPLARAHCSTIGCLSSSARLHVHAFHGQPAGQAHWSTGS
jgi:hypothetical protein